VDAEADSVSASAVGQGLRHGFHDVLAAAVYGWYGRRKRRGWAFVKFEESMGGSAMLPGRGGRSSPRRGNRTPATTVQGISLVALDGAEFVRWETCSEYLRQAWGRTCRYPDRPQVRFKFTPYLLLLRPVVTLQ
jgi:hypothetical protein